MEAGIESNTKEPASASYRRRYFRIFWPILAWIVFVLLLCGIHMHRVWLARTALSFKVRLNGNKVDYESMVKLDGREFSSGQNLYPGSHTLTIEHPKAAIFLTNFWVWYGASDLGAIELKRATGSLSVSLSHPATLNITGPGFTLNESNTLGGTWTVPTEHYYVEALFTFSKWRKETDVSANAVSTVRFDPELGKARIYSSHSETTYRLAKKSGAVDVSGSLPVVIDQLPVGEYDLITERLGQRQTRTVSVRVNETNEFPCIFKYGVLSLETDPPEAVVTDKDGKERGITPLVLPEVQEGYWKCKFERTGYEPVFSSIWIDADRTNYIRTNLVSYQFVNVMRAARDYLSSQQYDEAVKLATEALQYRREDSEAALLKRKANGLKHVSVGRTCAERGDFTTAITELNAALEFLPEEQQIKDMIARCEQDKKETEEHERRKRAEELAEEEHRTRIGNVRLTLATACKRYNGADSFAVHELSSTNDIRDVAKNIPTVMTAQEPYFELTRYEWLQDNFVMEYRQKVFDGSRSCVVVGAQVSTNESVVCFRVIEGQTPHGFSWAGGLISAQLSTESDRNGERAARFQQQIREGEKAVEERIRRAVQMPAVKN